MTLEIKRKHWKASREITWCLEWNISKTARIQKINCRGKIKKNAFFFTLGILEDSFAFLFSLGNKCWIKDFLSITLFRLERGVSCSFKPRYEQTTAAQSLHSMNRSVLIDSNPFQNILVWNFGGRCYIAPNICYPVSVVTTAKWLNTEATSICNVWNISMSFQLIFPPLGTDSTYPFIFL